MTSVTDKSYAIELLSSAIRSAIVAGEGRRFYVSDLASIEGRSLAYLAGEQWKLDAYRDYDLGIGQDLYVLAYSMAFSVPVEDVGKAERQLGKVLELGLGYGGGVGAFITFSLVNGVNLNELADNTYKELPDWAVDSAYDWWCESKKRGKTYNLEEKVFVTCDAIKRIWRSNNLSIAQFWYDLENAAKKVINEKRKDAIKIGKVCIDMRGTWMRIKLPSSRYLSYPGATVVSNKIRYLGLNMYSRKWCNLSTYGGKLAENVTQAFANDVFFYGLMEAEKRGYYPVLAVHDEGVTEGDGSLGIEGLNEALSVVPLWATGLPLAAEGFEGMRYRKG